MNTLLLALAEVLGDDALLFALLLTRDRAIASTCVVARSCTTEGVARTLAQRIPLELVVEQHAPQVGMARHR